MPKRYKNEKVIHTPKLRDYLVEHGGVLKRTKPDCKDISKDVYIFQYTSIKDIIGGYPGVRKEHKGGTTSAYRSKC